jgi:carbamoyltransferase
MSRDRKWLELFGIQRREPESEISQPYMDLALAIQNVTEQIVLRLAKTARELTDCPNLTMAGGVALNCVASGRLLKEKVFDRIWIQPAAGDAGGSIGAAYAARHIWQGRARNAHDESHDEMNGAYLGPAFDRSDVQRLCTKFGAVADCYDNFDQLSRVTAGLLAEGNVIGWFQGRMEMGPRALGNRSILGDPRNPDMQKRLNLKIKYREGFRPFAPSVLAECAAEYFDLESPSPYMLLVAPVKENICQSPPDNYDFMDMYTRLYHQRSEIPAVTHVDYSARIQTVHRETNERYWLLIRSFKEQTGCGVVVNTSFNVRGEPIVATPIDAYRCFMRTEMDYLVIGDFLFNKSLQPPFIDRNADTPSFDLD